jgi:hypothetical protein
MKTIVIGTRYFSFSAINSLTEAWAASSDVPLRAMISLPRFVIKLRPSRFGIDHTMHETAGRFASRVAAG